MPALAGLAACAGAPACPAVALAGLDIRAGAVATDKVAGAPARPVYTVGARGTKVAAPSAVLEVGRDIDALLPALLESPSALQAARSVRADLVR
jgi:hypothetical protein